MSIKQKIIISFAIGIFLVGCASHPADPKIAMTPPKYVEEMPPLESERMDASPGSLFGRGDNPLFSDRKAMNVNDLVTVVINEQTDQQTTASKSLSESNSNSLGGGVFGSAGGSKTVDSVARNLNKYGNVSFEAGSEDSFAAKGSNLRNEKFSTTVSARVIKILNNGNYFIEGRRELLISGEKQIVQISGVIRPYDIDQTNTIDSKYVADAKISYSTQGDIQETTEKGWGSKMVESVWPF